MIYIGVIAKTGAALLQVAAPAMTGFHGWESSAEVAPALPHWSDVSPKVDLGQIQARPVEISEKNSEALHRALIASFDEVVEPIILP